MEDFDINDLQRKSDRFVISARELSSRGASFLIVMLGVILQTSHTALLMYDVAAFKQEWLKIIVGIGIGVFISSALAIFTLKHDGKNKEIGQIITVFFYFEIFTNIFYYWNSLIFSKGFDNATTQNWLYLIIAMPFSFIMPFAIKKFAGVISADERLQFGSIDAPDVHETEENIDYVRNNSTEIIDAVTNAISEEFYQKIDGVKKYTDDTFLKKGSNIELTVGGKSAIVSLGTANDEINFDDEDSQEEMQEN